jgi:hypothetical protein
VYAADAAAVSGCSTRSAHSNGGDIDEDIDDDGDIDKDADVEGTVDVDADIDADVDVDKDVDTLGAAVL